ncbi:MAG: hypothetical protein AVDCRST_MAG49-3959, partial [uncultured Thermomicrobiales bacterium]
CAIEPDGGNRRAEPKSAHAPVLRWDRAYSGPSRSSHAWNGATSGVRLFGG